MKDMMGGKEMGGAAEATASMGGAAGGKPAGTSRRGDGGGSKSCDVLDQGHMEAAGKKAERHFHGGGAPDNRPAFKGRR